VEGNKGLLRTSCRICGSTRIHYRFITNGSPVCQCEDCDFMFVNPQPSEEKLAEIYKADYFLGSESDYGEKSVSGMKSRTAEMYLNHLLEYSGVKRGRLIEIGCGNGDFIALAKKKGFEVKGIEISGYAANTANARIGEDCVVCGTLEKTELPSEYFDICVLFDVIEHVYDPVGFLRKIHELLKPDGVIFIVTPSLDSWSARLMKSNWVEFKTEHLHYFNRQTIQNILAKTGFNKVTIAPNYKHLTLEYINAHFQKFRIPFFTNLISFFMGLAPERFRKKRIRLVASGMNVLARKSQLNSRETVSIVVPVYNEKSTFTKLMDALIAKQLRELNKEIIIVESNSTDGTREDVLKYKDSPGIKIILEEKPLGKGHAVRTGLKSATGNFVMIQDGDLEYDLNDYDELLEPLLKYRKAFVLGSRQSKGWKMRHFTDQLALSLIMNFGHIFFATLLNIFCRQNLKDPFTMYKVFRKDCIYGLAFKANRFDFDWEIVIKLLRKGYRPLEIPINYNSRSFKDGKKISFFKDPLLWLWALIRFRFGPLYEKKESGAWK